MIITAAPTFNSNWVYICHPVSSLGLVKARILANRASEYVISKGMLPISSVRLIGDLIDNNKDYDKAMKWSMDLVHVCNQLWVFSDQLTYGMKQEIEYASSLGMKIKFVNLVFKYKNPSTKKHCDWVTCEDAELFNQHLHFQKFQEV